jgi:nucleotide-binding universal stress UspA family protein
MSKPVIVAVDPHREDPDAVALGVLLARVIEAPLVLASAHAVDPPVDELYAEYANAARDQTEQALARLRSEVQQRAGATVAVSATAVSYVGSPAGALQRLAARKDAGIIVVGSSARGTAGRVLPGAVTDRLLHGAPCAVAVAPAGFADRDPSLALIGVAFLERADGRAALATGCDLARAADGLVRVLTVRDPTDWRLAGVLDAEQLAASRRMADESAERTLRAGTSAVPDARSAGGTLLYGPTHEALAAASADLDLLVCGSRGYGPVRTVLLGGVSHALVRHAACPVLVVPLAERTADRLAVA